MCAHHSHDTFFFLSFFFFIFFGSAFTLWPSWLPRGRRITSDAAALARSAGLERKCVCRGILIGSCGCFVVFVLLLIVVVVVVLCG